MSPVDLIKKFDKQAAMYDKKRKKMELGKWRARLLQTAHGRVLEVGVGAGANFPFYHRGVEVTAVDFSSEMLKKAKEAAREYNLNATFIQSDVESLTFPLHSFDTIISTLSLCSYQNPEQVLVQFSHWCKADGHILLMEHGLSSNMILSSLQKAFDPLIYRFIGCHHNRDMMGIIRSAPLIIEKEEHHIANMIHLVWAKPQK